MILKNYADPTIALRAMTNELKQMILKKTQEQSFHLALSGGNTARQMFNLWTKEYATEINWNKLRFYWVDERCVPPTDEESNYLHANKLLFTPLNIEPTHIFRIRGEYPPLEESVYYSNLVKKELSKQNGMPHFDAIILGIGTDAHTASIFPNNLALLNDDRLYTVSRHPVSDQYRVTMTGTFILNHTPLFIPVFGSDKKDMINKLKRAFFEEDMTPAAYILAKAENATIFTDIA